MSGEEPISKEATQAVVNFLKSNVPKSDVPNIETELKKDFVLSKTKGKKFKKKPKKKKSQNLTRKEKKALGFYVLPRNSVKYDDVLPMNQIWTDYISQMLELDKPIPNCTSKSWETFTQTLYKADFHGAMLTVVRSKCPSYVLKSGICIMDTRNTFKIISKDNIITTIPKRESVFEMKVKNVRITLFGKHFCVRPAERSTKKVKSCLHPDL
ncbi:ribonuclease P protein subunit p29 [Pectinophora gossypiella]|uniref:ribonuclease P protein subunit p29 n=1 Tax=Pectinophora gossypiella TaxID=13191 RepID=UPI00214F469A|nr:ribonuclease P protein subunit p29 [Pectinophora gossypiella]